MSVVEDDYLLSVQRRRRTRAAALAGAITFLSVADASIADNVAAGTVIGPILVPSGYTLSLLDDCGSRVAISGSNWVTGTTYLIPGTQRPVIYAERTSPVAAGPDCFVVSPTLTITAVRLPSDISGLVAGWNLTDATLDGSNFVTSVPGAWGTSNALTGAGTTKPLSKMVGPGGRRVVLMGASGQRSAFTLGSTLTLAACTVLVAIAPSTVSSGTQIIGTDNATTSYIRTGSGGSTPTISNIDVRSAGMSAAATFALPATGKIYDGRKEMILLMMTFDGAGDTATLMVDRRGSAITAAMTSATNFVIDRLGSRASGSDFSSGFLGNWPALVYDRVLTSDEIDQLFAMATPARSRDTYFSTSGTDSVAGGNNAGWSEADPKLSPVTWMNAAFGYADNRYLVKGSERFSVSAAIDPSGGAGGGVGIVTAPIRLQSYGTGKAQFCQSTRTPAAPATWVSIGGGAWTKAEVRAAKPGGIWVLTGGTDSDTGAPVNRTLLDAATAGGQWRFEWALNVLTIRLDDALDPNTLDIEIANASPVSFWDNSKASWLARDIEFFGCSAADAIHMSGANNQTQFCRFWGIIGDVLSIHGGPTIHIQPAIYRQGTGAKKSGETDSDSDGITSHGNVTTKVYNPTVKESDSYGVVDQENAQTEYYDPLLIENYKNFTKLATGSDVGSSLIRRGKVVRSADTTVDNGVQFGLSTQDLNASTTSTVEYTLFVGLGTTRGKAIQKYGGAALVQSGNSQTGFNSLT